ncbi:carbohydrate-binding protein SusD [Pedobacter psychrophilus]|uniref:Carbohydrate-binding protein SusD n=1 Tax=Pedobacter psychrophilus TaxID=1826909 RepID=A0A179DLU2_9SPHI|nr:RagB/SusD family nutrient uptake outer membrane protein [Pedobacter psychrophilus]OAQ42015.1 carbohydrate-binding protein SusD [Pedobacter psychrophilus]
MKKIIYILSLNVIIIMAGCQKLDRDFVTSLTREQINATYGNKSNEVLGLYNFIPDGMLYIGGNAMMASASDEAEHTFERSTIQSFNNGSWNQFNNPDNVWGNYYTGIRKANQVIVSLDDVDLEQFRLDPSPSAQGTFLSRTADIKRWKYEARFLRAYFYFELIKRYGGVPLLKESIGLDTDFTTLKRNTLQECVDFISSECDSAALQLPLPYTDVNDIGRRATKFAALALKSRVLLYAASDLFNTPTWAGGYSNPELISLNGVNRSIRWRAASDAAKACIDAMSTVNLNGSYQGVFNNFNIPEIILAKRTTANNTFERNNSPVGFPSGQGLTTPSQNQVDAYEMKPTGKPISDATSGYNPNNPYQNRDPRLGFTVALNNVNFGTPVRPVESFVGGLDGFPLPNATKTGYYLRKYIQESLNVQQNQTGVHSWIVFRLPELFLNYAEALNEVDPGNPDIKTYVDRVRARSTVAMPALPAGLLQLDMRNRIKNERRVEFAFEDHRFWDVRRWMEAPLYFNTPLRGVTITRTSPTVFSYNFINVENRVFEPKMYLYPIPQSDVNIATGILQNPLWN